jgi:hypothetical protein
MIRRSDRFRLDPRRARTELAAAWEQVLSAAEQGARQFGDTSRRRGVVVRERAAAARLALRGELLVPRWRWVGAAFLTGVVVGVAGAVLARRSRAVPPETEPESAPEAGLEPAPASGSKGGPESVPAPVPEQAGAVPPASPDRPG